MSHKHKQTQTHVRVQVCKHTHMMKEQMNEGIFPKVENAAFQFSAAREISMQATLTLYHPPFKMAITNKGNFHEWLVRMCENNLCILVKI